MNGWQENVVVKRDLNDPKLHKPIMDNELFVALEALKMIAYLIHDILDRIQFFEYTSKIEYYLI